MPRVVFQIINIDIFIKQRFETLYFIVTART